MKKTFGRVVTLVFLVVLAVGCGRRGRVIPADKFSDIYADMLLADQWLSSNSKARRVADTSLFYEPIFDKYGYSLKDYEYSVRHYMKKPAKFSKILDASATQLTNYSKRLQSVEDEIRSRHKFSPYTKIDFDADTILWQLDTNALKADSLAVADSLVNPADTLLSQSDSLLATVDSLSLQKDSIVNQILTDTINYERKRDTEEMLLLHGSDDSASGRHRVKRQILGRKSNQTAQ